ncbi:PQQ-dependent dehydrogenase, methanol/ethanol family [Parasphingopyxis marina]|uniref:PQQ-dependent dehydrogenase, methanol/ethanol family n=1 Tax=Parasphingopyxis marina TaxID=2761622 RepID=A0A842I170_9SPHN|nr:PQQ-dependent dehydrogenase, methanol/ethanol family [Parasphingopyxis marina]MBC2778409.1 PQQ-dependent dehydrogenase, methanol/ethanol family [Parasphingopyxis marina]
MRTWIGLALALGIAACSSGNNPGSSSTAQGAAKIDGDYLSTGGDGSDWPAVNYSYAEQRFSPLQQVNRDNVGQLGIAWYAELPDARAQEATPVVVDGVMYITGPWSKVFAYDARNGEPLWSFDPDVPRSTLPDACCDAVNRGIAVWRGKLYVGTLDGRLIALDAITGAQLWSTQTTDQDRPYTITGAPRVVNNHVIIGNGGAEFGVRGYVSAYDANTGALEWRFYTVPNPSGAADNAASDEVMRTARRTWSDEGQWHETGGGGTVWDAIVYDHELDQLYIGVGNGSPWNHGLRSNGQGDNLFLSSIVALDPDTGEYLWHYQETPGETWDYTATQPIILADVEIDGRPRKVLMHAPKNGFFFVIDRETGSLISADAFVEGINWATGYDDQGRPIENEAARFYRTGEPFIASPGPIGAHNWQPMAFSPQTGLVYIPANIAPQIYIPPGDEEQAQLSPVGFNTGTNLFDAFLPRDEATLQAAMASLRGQLVAWDPVAREARWRVDYPTPWNGGILTTAGGLVLQGTATGEFKAYDAATGEELWSMDVQSGVLAGASTYLVDGEQYIAFTTSRGGAYTITAGQSDMTAGQVPNIPRLIVLRIGGTGVLPDAPDLSAVQLNPPEATGTPEQLVQGERLYTRYCMICHGEGAGGGGVNPDLRFSGALGDAAAWRALVLGETLRANGMPDFSDVLNPARADAIRHYVIDKANWDLARLRARREEEADNDS